MTRVAVTGATGRLGRRLLPRLVAAGHEVTAVSRRPHADETGVRWTIADLRDRTALTVALAGAEAIVHCATSPRGEEPAAQVLVGAAPPTAHLVYVSIVGVDRHPLGYYRRKLAAERVFLDSRRPVTIQRATQFHDLVRGLFEVQRRLPRVFVGSATSIQPVEAAEVAARLVEIVGGRPLGHAPDFGGPQVVPMDDLARTYLRSTGTTKRISAVRVPGGVGRAFRDGVHLSPGHRDGTTTFEQYLTT